MIWSPPPAFTIEAVELKALPPGAPEGGLRVSATVRGMTDDPALLFLLSEHARATDLVRMLAHEADDQPENGIIQGFDVTPNGATLECRVRADGAQSGSYRVAVVQFRSRGGEIAISDEPLLLPTSAKPS
ncbi:MAG: hypothetical protein HOV80_04355 [Polyangiaceae bacterium]|nr:hypothetical protein [Polyangiaceae bacterium]